MSFLQGFGLAVGAVAVSLAVSGCGGGGGGDATTTTTKIITTTTITTTLATSCRQDQAQCSHCLNHTCLGCNPDYVLEENSTVVGGRCVASCIGQPAPEKPGRPATPFDLNGKAWPQMCIDATSAHFFGIGDWGGSGAPGATWTNPGKCAGRRLSESDTDVASEGERECTDADHWAQKYVARQMGKVAPTSKPDYVLNVGDNFYPGGINRKCGDSNTPGKDPTGQWSNQFDQVYGVIPALADKPWLSVLGNHDYGGYGWYNGWDQQIFETWERDVWILPGQFWSQKVQYADFSVDYFFLDSNVVDVWDTDPNHYICQHDPTLTCWGVNQTKCPDWFAAMWTAGKKMTEDGLKKSTAEWHIIVTHFPPPTVYADADFKAMNTAYGIDLIFTGHKHDQETGIDPTTKIPWIISGGGGGVTADANPDFPGGHDQAYGFVDFAINRTNIEFYMHSWGGEKGEIIIQDTVTLTAHQHKKFLQDTSADVVV